MEKKGHVRLKGTVTQCTYNNKTDIDFPESYVSFSIDSDSNQIYFLIGSNNPPLQAGNYVEGIAFRKTLSDGEQSIPAVYKLKLFDCKGGRLLALYEFNEY